MCAEQSDNPGQRLPGLLVAALCLFSSPVRATDATILYFEPVVLVAEAGLSAQADGDRLSFDAFGRRFVLQLTENSSLNRQRRSQGFTLMAGQLEGLPDSWVRVTQRGPQLSGLISDGTTLYGIEPWPRARSRTLDAAPRPGTTNIIYRLDDVLVPPGALTCEVARADAPPLSAAQAISELAGELDVPPTLEAQGATRRITLAAVADFEFMDFFQRRGEDPDEEILGRLNMVDGLYSEQFALQVELAKTTTYPTDNDPFTTTQPSELLSEVSDFRFAEHVVNNRPVYGLTHLLTGRRLDGTTRGIAWLGGACSTLFGAALSEQDADPVIGALVIAHEIGHNLNAQHDGEAPKDAAYPNPCESVSRGFLMWPVVDGSNEFSQCSLDTMAAFVASPQGACVTALATTTPAPPSAPADQGSGSGGGGGAVGLPLLALLLTELRRRRNR